MPRGTQAPPPRRAPRAYAIAWLPRPDPRHRGARPFDGALPPPRSHRRENGESRITRRAPRACRRCRPTPRSPRAPARTPAARPPCRRDANGSCPRGRANGRQGRRVPRCRVERSVRLGNGLAEAPLAHTAVDLDEPSLEHVERAARLGRHRRERLDELRLATRRSHVLRHCAHSFHVPAKRWPAAAALGHGPPTRERIEDRPLVRLAERRQSIEIPLGDRVEQELLKVLGCALHRREANGIRAARGEDRRGFYRTRRRRDRPLPRRAPVFLVRARSPRAPRRDAQALAAPSPA